MNRVAVTGIGGICPLGQDIETIFSAIRDNQSGIVLMPEWDMYQGLRTRLAGTVKGLKFRNIIAASKFAAWDGSP